MLKIEVQHLEILYKLLERIGNIYPDRFGKESTYERGGRRKEDKEWTYHFDGEGLLWILDSHLIYLLMQELYSMIRKVE